MSGVEYFDVVWTVKLLIAATRRYATILGWPVPKLVNEAHTHLELDRFKLVMRLKDHLAPYVAWAWAWLGRCCERFWEDRAADRR